MADKQLIDIFLTILAVGVPTAICIALCVGASAFLGEAAQWYWAQWYESEEEDHEQ